jgi:hypothetical protein
MGSRKHFRSFSMENQKICKENYGKLGLENVCGKKEGNHKRYDLPALLKRINALKNRIKPKNIKNRPKTPTKPVPNSIFDRKQDSKTNLFRLDLFTLSEDYLSNLLKIIKKHYKLNKQLSGDIEALNSKFIKKNSFKNKIKLF